MMPFLDKLLPSRKCFKSSVECSLPSSCGTAEDGRAGWLGKDHVRILLFRECEWRGRKLLFDSVTLEKYRCKREENSGCNAVRDNVSEKCAASVNVTAERELQGAKTAENDVSLLSEMAFGTVAMTYRGSSFKVHSLNSPPCLMCTKVFPVTEHSTCRQSEKLSDEALGRLANVEANSSNTSVRTVSSRVSSGNLSGNDLSPGARKSSTCSSVGSGWDIDIPARLGSTQSLEGNGSSGVGSLSSLRRRWLRAISTSLTRSDSDDAFGIQHWTENSTDARDGHAKRHKTRLGLTMLVRLPQGQESKAEIRLLEHMALLEGMLDRLRYFCVEANCINGHSNGKGGMLLADRMYRASSRFVISLLRLLVNITNLRTPLLWHDVLLNSTITVEEKTNTLYRGLQQMCQLLDDVDTKSTNFFLSTVVTAVLTYHLGWVYTVLPSHDRQMMEKLGRCYPCNPLWAQLGDLYGALGNPVKVVHTVVAGDSRKTDIINSVLSCLSYFIRSGTVQKRREYRCPSQQDVRDATNALEQERIKRPQLFNNPKQTQSSNDGNRAAGKRESRSLPIAKAQMQLHPSDIKSRDSEVQRASPEYQMERSNDTDSSSHLLKRSSTMKKNLDTYMFKRYESQRTELDAKLICKELLAEDTENDKPTSFQSTEKDCASSKVKIIVSEIESQEADVAKEPLPRFPELSLQSFEKKLYAEDVARPYMSDKVDDIETPSGNTMDPLKLYSSRPDFQSISGMGATGRNNESQVYFTLGDEEKYVKSLPRLRIGYNCQCSNTFTRVPSTSAELPEGVLRKIIQRNFPESSKSMHPPPGAGPSMGSKGLGFCLKCNGHSYPSSQNYEGTNELLETPTNATEVLRTCGNTGSEREVRLTRSNSLDALIEANSVVELPMPRSKKTSTEKTNHGEDIGFVHTLVQNRTSGDDRISLKDPGYTWGLALQGITKRKKKRRKWKKVEEEEGENGANETEKEWWHFMREEVFADARFPTIDHPVSEALCILADLDTWHVGILSNTTPSHNPPVPVGMSRLVSNMLEAFAYVWRKYHSPAHCVKILEGKMREMWLRSEALAEMLMTAEMCDASVANLTNALDVDAADIPLLLAVATTHSPEIAQRFGLTLA